MKTFASRIGGALAITAIAFFGLKGCVVTTWSSPSEPTTYAVRGSDGRSLSLIFLPKNETIFVYAEKEPKYLEMSLAKMKGVYGTNYFGGLWRIEGPGVGAGWFGLRLYPEGAEPVVMETTVLKKFVHGSSKPTLPSEGERTHPVILFSKDQVEFAGMRLDREATDATAVQIALQALRPQK